MEPRGRIPRPRVIPNHLFALAFPVFVAPAAAFFVVVFVDPGGVRARSAFRELLESFLAGVAEFHAVAAALCFRT